MLIDGGPEQRDMETIAELCNVDCIIIGAPCDSKLLLNSLDASRNVKCGIRGAVNIKSYRSFVPHHHL